MVQKTSWEGEFTKALRRKGMRGAYTRYGNRSTRSGLVVARPREANGQKFREIRTPQGVLVGYERNEPKKKTYSQVVKKQFIKLRRK